MPRIPKIMKLEGLERAGKSLVNYIEDTQDLQMAIKSFCEEVGFDYSSQKHSCAVIDLPFPSYGYEYGLYRTLSTIRTHAVWD